MNPRSLTAVVVLGAWIGMPISALPQQRSPKDKMDMPKMHSGRIPPVSSLFPADGASVEILSPKEGEVFQGDRVPVRFKIVKGRQGNHIHAYVDGDLMGMFETETGTLTGIAPGRHRLDVRMVAKDHRTELKASDSVVFVMK